VKISLDWLADFVVWEDNPADLAARLTAAGLNVEAIEEVGQSYPGVVVGRVVTREDHPAADRLSVCRVDTGSGGEPIAVVCGAANVAADQTILLATVGAVLPGGLRIKRSKIRGIESHGMICSAAELVLSEEADGILVLDDAPQLGTTADELIGYTDTVLDIEVTPNRPDWLSHLGVAREVAAIYGTKLALPSIAQSGKSGERLGIQVEIADYADCPRYTAHGARGVTVGPSPRFMQNRLRAVGARPINNVVDVTNYVMFELGQPLHAFDREKLTGDRLVVKRAQTGQKVVALDGEELTLTSHHLVIADESGPVALAGVMGLQNSEVDGGTSDIVLESAFFAPGIVRSMSRELGLISESSYRFERQADREMVETAARRALYLLREHAGALAVADWTDRQDPDQAPQDPVPLRVFQVNRVLGIDIDTERTASLLRGLGLSVQPMGNPDSIGGSAVNMMVEIPSFRRDLAGEIDLIEEIARSYGYDHIAGSGGFRGAMGGLRRRIDLAQARIRSHLVAGGYAEIVTSSFQTSEDVDRLRLGAEDVRRNCLSILDPHHGGDTVLRTSLLPGLFEVVRRNLNADCLLPARFFQINKVYWPAGRKTVSPRHADDVLLPEEPLLLQLALAGQRGTGAAGVPADLLELKGVVQTLARALGLTWRLVPGGEQPYFTESGQWQIVDGEDKPIGEAGQINAYVRNSYDIEEPVAVAEIDLIRADLEPAPVLHQSFSRFPAVKRDLSLLVPEGVAYQDLTETLRGAASDLLESVELFDIYHGKGLEAGTRAIGIRLKFRSSKGNLKGKTVDKAIARVEAALADRLGVRLRG